MPILDNFITFMRTCNLRCSLAKPYPPCTVSDFLSPILAWKGGCVEAVCAPDRAAGGAGDSISTSPAYCVSVRYRVLVLISA